MEQWNNETKSIVSDETKDVLKSLWESSPPLARNRSSKKKVAEAWRRVKSKPDSKILLESMRAWSNSGDWQRDGGQFVQGLHIWIKDEKWESLPEAVEINRPAHESWKSNAM